MTLHGTSFMFNEAAFCAIVGGGCQAFAGNVALPFNRLLWIPAFSTISTIASAQGCRSYLAVSGGFNIKKVMGSASTYVPSGIGGIHGRTLVGGDLLPFKREQHVQAGLTLKMLPSGIGISHWHTANRIPALPGVTTVHAIEGPEFDRFQVKAQKNIYSSVLTISSRSNRMGYRLDGNKFTLEQKFEMVSTPVTAGIVQVTHEGDPIILMADAQTTGGYPRIARVCTADIPLLAQMRPGQMIQFSAIGEEESLLRYKKILEGLMMLKTGLKS
jgi:antagonist of KipI